jgi:hypothetical protein
MTAVVAAICTVIPSLIVRYRFNNGLAVYCLSSGVLFALSVQFRAAFEAVKRIPTWTLLAPLLLTAGPSMVESHYDGETLIASLRVSRPAALQPRVKSRAVTVT